MEQFKDIEGYEGLYKISSKGRVISLSNEFSRKEKELKSFKRNGYPSVQLHKNTERKKFFIHRLIAKTFLPNPDNLPWINHKDEDKSNFNLENLEWCTPRYNSIYSLTKEKASDDIVKDFIKQRLNKFLKKNEISKEELIELLREI